MHRIHALLLCFVTLLSLSSSWTIPRFTAVFSTLSRYFIHRPESFQQQQKCQVDQYQFYEFDGARISYRYRSVSTEDTSRGEMAKLLLIHPIGIGQASWFWDRFIYQWFNVHNDSDSPLPSTAMYAVNLLGCGATSEGSAMWNMTRQTEKYVVPEIVPPPVSFPIMIWVQQCESLINEVICPTKRKNSKLGDKVTIVAQGGLAPVAVLLAARNPNRVQSLILTSPPTYRDLTAFVSESSLRTNYKALCGDLLGNFAFYLLFESRWAVRFFSNLFLFSNPCDDTWVDRAMAEAGPAVRFPVQLFNAGYCSYRSYEKELVKQIVQPTLIIEGMDDKRNRTDFSLALPNCRLMCISGKNVLPWESPTECCHAIQQFLYTLN